MYILPSALAPMATYCQFILVQFVVIAGSWKEEKFPCHPETLDRHDAHNPIIWRSLAQISVRAAALGPSYGVAFVITESDPFVCLDIDDCAEADGSAWSSEALALIEQFPGAVEVSRSGRGLHIWGMYSHIPEHRAKRKKDLGGGLELYSKLRFIALGAAANGQMYDLTTILPGFVAAHFRPDPVADGGAADGWPVVPHPDYTPLDDVQLLSKALASKPRDTAASVFGGAPQMIAFADFWTCNIPALAAAFPSSTGKQYDGSSVDWCLAKDLAYWTGKDAPRIQRLMLMSALVRDKWHYHKEYLRNTIKSAIAACNAVYHVKPILPPSPLIIDGAISFKAVPQIIEHNTYVGRENLATIFANCVYVRDTNMILLPSGDMVDQSRFNAEFAGYAFSMDNNNEKTVKSAWDAFLHNQIIRFPRVEGCAFEPALPFQDVIQRGGRSWINIYKAPVVIMSPGDVAPFMLLLNTLLPNGDDAKILLSWMAAVVQYRGTKFRWSPFVQGTKGNGKSTITECLIYALGDKYVFSVKAKAIMNQEFNSWLENNILYVADDLYSVDDRGHMMEELKTLITDTRHAVTYKGIDSIQKRICGNFIFNSNHKNAIIITDDERRHCPLYCAQQTKADKMRDGLNRGYFAKLYTWLAGGGFAHVAHMLHTMLIDERFNPAGDCQEAPITTSWEHAVNDSKTALAHEIAEWIELQQPGFAGNYVSLTMLKKKVEAIPKYQRSSTPLKLNELLETMGYHRHAALPGGRTVMDVMPDGMRSIIYVKQDTKAAEIDNPADVGKHYQACQQWAQGQEVERRFNAIASIGQRPA